MTVLVLADADAFPPKRPSTISNKTGDKAKPVPYKRRDYFKITLIVGKSTIQYADRILEIEKQALVFSNPLIPYKWEHAETIHRSYYCIFNQHFFHQYGNLNQYEVYQPNGLHVFDLTDEQVKTVTAVYERMFEKINSDYAHKYDVLRNLVFELLHFAMKMQPSTKFVKKQLNASRRISSLFLELLERQFPIDETHQRINLRSASDFADHLNIHVNHLNRAIKETAQKTTSQIIAERIMQEAKNPALAQFPDFTLMFLGIISQIEKPFDINSCYINPYVTISKKSVHYCLNFVRTINSELIKLYV